MKKKLLALLFGMSLILAACGGGGDDAQPADNSNGGDTAAAAEQVAKQTCSACHGQDLKGAMGPDLTAIGSKYSEDEIKDIIKNGRGDMPAQSQLSDDDVNAVASWLASKK